MRWNVHGSDATTGHDIVLALDEPSAAQAVQAAIDKQIVVSHVTQEAGDGLRRKLLPAACVGLVIAGSLAIALYVQNLNMQAKLGQAVGEQKELAHTVAQAETASNDIRQGKDEQTTAVQEMAAQLTEARAALSRNQQQLALANGELLTARQAAEQLPALKGQIADLGKALTAAQTAATTAKSDAGNNQTIAKLQQEIVLARRRQQELEAVASKPATNDAKITALEESNKELAKQVDLLQTQLLADAVKHVPVAVAEPEPMVAPVRWAMRTSYTAASEFLLMQFDKDSMGIAAIGNGVVATTGAKPANAATFRFEHDRNHERVYAATLSLSLSPDMPRDKMAENQAMASGFLKLFAVSLSNADAVLAGAEKDLAAKDESQRLVLMGPDYKLTIWNGGNGVYTLRVESPRGDAQ